jgi:hypothetical protein
MQSSTRLKIFKTYDYFLTIELEINLIWSASWTYTKIIYLGVRYSPMVSTFFLLRRASLLSTSLEGYELRLTTTEQLFFDVRDCRRSFIVATCMVGSQYPRYFEPHASQVFPGLVCFLQKVRAATTCSNHSQLFPLVILGLRTWAVFHRNRKVGCVLALLVTGNVLAVWCLLARYLRSLKCESSFARGNLY